MATATKLTPDSMAVLEVLSRGGPYSINDIALYADLPKSRIHQALEWLGDLYPDRLRYDSARERWSWSRREESVEQPAAKAPAKRTRKPKTVTDPDGKPVPFTLNPRSDGGRVLALIQRYPRLWLNLTWLSLATKLTNKQVGGALSRLRKFFPDQMENHNHTGLWRWNSDDATYATERTKLYEINGWPAEPEDMLGPNVTTGSSPPAQDYRTSDDEPTVEQLELPFDETPEQSAPAILTGPKQHFRTIGIIYNCLIIEDAATGERYEAVPFELDRNR